MFGIIGDEYIDQKIIYSTADEIKLEDMLIYFGARKLSIMGEIVTRVFNYLTIGRWELINDYEDFYKQEYDDFGTYLTQKHNFYDKLVAQIIEKIENKEKVFLVETSFKKDYNAKHFITDEEGFAQISDFFER